MRSTRRPRIWLIASTKLDQRVPSARPDVERYPVNLRVGGGQIRFHHVVHICEIPRLLPVAEDRHRFPSHGKLDELWDHRRVLRGRILPRAEDIEVAQ